MIIEICRALPTGLLEDSDLLKKVVTCVEPHIPKQYSKTALQEIGMSNLCVEKKRECQSQISDSHFILTSKKLSINHEFVRPEQIFSQELHFKVFLMFTAAHSSKRQNVWVDKCILHHDNVPSQTTVSVKRILTKRQTPLLEFQS
jgi:hypothetical protein